MATIDVLSGDNDTKTITVSNTNPLPVTVKSGTVVVTTDSANPLATTIPLLSGEDQTNQWLAVVKGAFQSYRVIPLGTAGGTMPVSDKILGIGGAIGDFLDKFVLSVSSNTNAAVYIRDGSALDVASGTTGTNPAGTTTLAVTASAAQTWTTNQYANYIVRVTYTPTSGVSTTIKRKIASHAAVAASTAITFILSHAIPAGATITAWGLEPIASSWEVVPYNTPVGIYSIPIEKKSTLGAFKVSVDLGVQVEATGKFS